MLAIGRINRLRVVREVDFGLYLDGGDTARGGFGEILLPGRYVPKGCTVGDALDVFVHFDSEDRIIATTERPYAMVGEFALLKVASVTKHGIFLDWGLPKDLLLPFNEQVTRMEAGKSYVVRIFLDADSHRIAASAKLDLPEPQVPKSATFTGVAAAATRSATRSTIGRCWSASGSSGPRA